MKWIVPLLFCAAPAVAQDAMTGPEFDAYTRGKTFYYGDGDNPYGGEEYLDNQQVRWSFLDGDCKDGRWYEDGALICFVYDDSPEAHCWSFFQSPGGLVARFENDPGRTVLYEMNKSDDPMLCLGPEVGV